MASANRPARLNRALLATLGLILAVSGAGTAAWGLGLLRTVLPGLDPTVPLTPAQVHTPGWAVYAMIAVAAAAGVLCLCWLLAQLRRRPKNGHWTLPAPAGDRVGDRATGAVAGVTRFGTDDAAAAAAADIDAYPGVDAVTADLTGDPHQPTLHLVVTLAPEASAATVRARIHDHAAPRLRRALDIESLQTRLVLRADHSAPARTS